MASLNKVILIGNLTRDPELRYIPSGKPVCTMRLAVSERYRTASGENREDSLFIDIIVWGKQGENCSTYLKKGRSVYVEGRLKIRDFDARDGSKRRAVEVNANRVVFLGSGGGGREGARDAGRESGRAAEAPAASDAGGSGEPVEEPLPGYEEPFGDQAPE